MISKYNINLTGFWAFKCLTYISRKSPQRDLEQAVTNSHLKLQR